MLNHNTNHILGDGGYFSWEDGKLKKNLPFNEHCFELKQLSQLNIKS